MKSIRRIQKGNNDDAQSTESVTTSITPSKSSVLSSFFSKSRSNSKSSATSTSAFSSTPPARNEKESFDSVRPSNVSFLSPYSSQKDKRCSRSVDDLTQGVVTSIQRGRSPSPGSRSNALDMAYHGRNQSITLMVSEESASSMPAVHAPLIEGPVNAKEGWLAKRTDQRLNAAQDWKLYRVMLKGSKMYFYKPVNEQNARKVFFKLHDASLSTTTILSGHKGLSLNPTAFDTSAYASIFESSKSSTLPLISKYIYGEVFVEVENPTTMEFKQYTCILIFTDTVLICRRKVHKNPSDRLKCAIKFAASSQDDNMSISDNVSVSSNRTQDTINFDADRGTFSKWKIDSFHRLLLLDTASLDTQSSRSKGSTHNVLHLLISTPEEVVHRFFFPVSEPEVITIFTAKMAAAKEEAMRKRMRLRDMTHETFRTAQGERADTTGSLRPESMISTQSSLETGLDQKRKRSFWGSGTHPDLIIKQTVGMIIGSRSVCGGTVDALVHELIFGTMAQNDYKAYLAAFLLTYLDFGEVNTTLEELERCAKMLVKAKPDVAQQRLRVIMQTWCSEYAFDAQEEDLLNKLDPIINLLGDDKKDDFRSSLAANRFVHNQYEPEVFEDSRADVPELGNLLITGLTPSLLLRLPSDFIAQQLWHFHLHRYRQWHISTRAFVDHATIQEQSTLNLFLFTYNSPHFLTNLILHHILIASRQYSLTQKKSQVIEQWIKVGLDSIKLGDMCSWMAIVFAICSPSVIRLKETWNGITDKNLRNIVMKEWAPRFIAMRKAEIETGKDLLPMSNVVHQPNVLGVPYFGNIKLVVDHIKREKSENLLDRSIEIPESLIDFQKNWLLLDAVTVALRKWQQEVRSSRESTAHVPLVTPSRAMQRYFDHLAGIPISSALGSEELFEASLAAEPCLHGSYLRARAEAGEDEIPSIAYLPLLFTAPTKVNRFFDDKVLLMKMMRHTRRAPSQASAGFEISRSQHQRSASSPAAAANWIRELDAPSCSDRGLLQSMRDLAGVGEQSVSVRNGELVLKSIASLGSSHRNSFFNELLTSPVSDDGDFESLTSNSQRKPRPVSDLTSIASSSKRLSKESEGSKINIVPKSGTIHRLIDVLILGIHDYLKESEMKTIAGHDKTVDFRMDEYISTFFATYRVFISPIALLEEFEGRFINAKNELDNSMESWHAVARTHSGILNALQSWISTHFDDFWGDLKLQQMIVNCLTTFTKEISHVWQEMLSMENFSNKLLEDYNQEFDATLLNLKTMVADQLFAPCWEPSSKAMGIFTKIHRSMQNEQTEMPSIDSMNASQLLMGLNSAINIAFQLLNLKDCMLMFDLIEAQSMNMDGWFMHRRSTRVEDEIFIADIFITMDQVQASGFAGANQDVRFRDLLPKSIQILCALHTSIKLWAISEIASVKIDITRRMHRIQILLDTIAHSRALMNKFDMISSPETYPGNVHGVTKRILPSFVEDALIAALLSPESRAYVRTWLEVAAIRGGNLDSIDSLIQEHTGNVQIYQPQKAYKSSNNSSGVILVPSIGWLIERMLELACFVPNGLLPATNASAQLIYFDKSRYVFNLVQLYLRMQDDLADVTNDFGKFGILICHRDRISTGLDWKLVKECALREGVNIRMSNEAANISNDMGRNLRTFYVLLNQEAEKIGREFELFEKSFPSQTDSRTSSTAHKKAKSQKFPRINSFLKGVLPNSSAVGGTPSNSPIDHLAQELYQISGRNDKSLGSIFSIVAHSRPALVINLINSKAEVQTAETTSHSSGRVGVDLPHSFSLVTEEGASHLLKSVDSTDMTAWIKAIDIAAKESSLRRRTLEAEDSQAGLSDPMINDQQVFNNSNVNERNSVYGVDIGSLVEREGRLVPLIVEKCLSEIEARGLQEVGIYRLAGSSGSIAKLRAAFNKNVVDVDFSNDAYADINVVADAIKQWFRSLPEPLIPFHLYPEFIQAMTIEEYNDKLYRLKDLVHELPKPNFEILKRLVEHLEKVTDYEQVNHMYAHNLAIVFGPTLFKPPPGPASFVQSMGNLGHAQNVVKNLILQYHWIWDLDTEEAHEVTEDVNAQNQDASGGASNEDVGHDILNEHNGMQRDTEQSQADAHHVLAGHDDNHYDIGHEVLSSGRAGENGNPPKIDIDLRTPTLKQTTWEMSPRPVEKDVQEKEMPTPPIIEEVPSIRVSFAEIQYEKMRKQQNRKSQPSGAMAFDSESADNWQDTD